MPIISTINLLSAPLALGIWALIIFKISTRYCTTIIVDHANDRSSHTGTKPRYGGIALMGCWLPAFLIYGNASLLVPLAISFMVGLADDLKNLRPVPKLIGQFLAGLSFILLNEPLPFFSSSFGYVREIFALVSFVGIINLVNFFDGIDGLMVGVSLCCILGFAYFLGSHFLLCLAPGLLVALCVNWSPSRTFMGDSGSHLIGAAIATIVLSSSSPKLFASSIVLTSPLLIDPVYTLLSRIVRGENIFTAHRDHWYQRLVDKLKSHREVAELYILSTILVSILLGAYF